MRLHTWNSGVFFFRVQGVTASTERYDSFLQGVDFYEHKLSFSCPFFFCREHELHFLERKVVWNALRERQLVTKKSWPFACCTPFTMVGGADGFFRVSIWCCHQQIAGESAINFEYLSLFFFFCVCFLCSCWPNLYSTYSNDESTGDRKSVV